MDAVCGWGLDLGWVVSGGWKVCGSEDRLQWQKWFARKDGALWQAKWCWIKGSRFSTAWRERGGLFATTRDAAAAG